VTTNQVLIGVGLILVLAVGSQVLASRPKIPALIILLPAGFTAGAITTPWWRAPARDSAINSSNS
jgi:NhaP-type Na+/H+ or K+/H+ antiporter